MNNDVLIHHGVKGQRWGVRNYQNEDGSLTDKGQARYAKNYKPSQRAQDEVHYGRRGMERINRQMRDQGYNVSTARSVEANRINKARKRATTMRKVGRTVGTIGGAIAGYATYRKFKSSTLGQSIEALNNPIVGTLVAGTLTKGMSSVGSTLGEYGGQSLGMISSGYSPDQYRYV